MLHGRYWPPFHLKFIARFWEFSLGTVQVIFQTFQWSSLVEHKPVILNFDNLDLCFKVRGPSERFHCNHSFISFSFFLLRKIYPIKFICIFSFFLERFSQSNLFAFLFDIFSDQVIFRVFRVKGKVTGQCPQIITFEEKGEPKRNRTDVLLLTSLTPYRWAKPAHYI